MTRLLYVGGLDDRIISLEDVQRAFLTFGEVKQIFWGNPTVNIQKSTDPKSKNTDPKNANPKSKDPRNKSTDANADLNIPPSPQMHTYAFVEFAELQDAQAALDNMHLAELQGLVIKCNWALNDHHHHHQSSSFSS